MKKCKLVVLAVSLSVLLSSPVWAQWLQPTGEQQKQSSFEQVLVQKKPLFPKNGFYFENGYGYALLTEAEDRDVVHDSFWLDARLGYLVHEHIGIHLEVSYFNSSYKEIRGVDANYFKIGPGVKFLLPLGQSHFALFSDLFMGYGKATASSSSFGVTVSQNGFAVGVDGGVMYKPVHWFGMSPYIAVNSIYGTIEGEQARSGWFTTGAMFHFYF